MPANTITADRIAEYLLPRGCTIRRRFGGIEFLYQLHAVAGIWGELVMVGLTAADFAAAVQLPGVRQHAPKRIQTDGHVVLSPERYDRDDELELWLQRSWHYHIPDTPWER
ncbi:MAG: hypothetical protein RLZZ297_1865 [Chloroflexota bacterium]|jgi:hypothetical protein